MRVVLYDIFKTSTLQVVFAGITTLKAWDTTTSYPPVEKADGAEAGEKFRIKGKWEGIVTTFLYYNIYRDEDNKLLDTRVLEDGN